MRAKNLLDFWFVEAVIESESVWNQECTKNVIFETDKSEMEVNKQENGYECGMHVLEIAYQLIDTKFYSSGMLETNQQGYPDWHVNKTSNRNLLLFSTSKSRKLATRLC